MDKKGIMLVILTAIISGFSIFVNSIGVKEFDSSLFTFLKNSVVAVVLLCIILGIGKWSELKILTKKQWSQLMGIGFIGGSIPFLLFFKGLQLTSGTTGSFIHKTMFIFVAFFAVAFLKEKLAPKIVVGATLLIAGNYLLIRPDFALSVGHMFILIATVFWAAESTLSKHVLKDISSTVVAFGRMFFGSLFIQVFLKSAGKMASFSSLTTTHILWIGLTSLFLIGYVLTFYNGLARIPVILASCIMTLGSPITTVLGWIFSDKPVTLFQAGGIFLILVGIIVLLGLGRYISSMRGNPLPYEKQT